MDDAKRREYADSLEEWAASYQPNRLNPQPEIEFGQLILDAHLRGFLEASPAVNRIVDILVAKEMATPAPPPGQRVSVYQKRIGGHESLPERVFHELRRFDSTSAREMASAMAKLIRGDASPLESGSDAHRLKLFPLGDLNDDPELREAIIKLQTDRSDDNTDAEILREITSESVGSDPKAKRLASRIRRARQLGKTTLPARG